MITIEDSKIKSNNYKDLCKTKDSDCGQLQDLEILNFRNRMAK